MKKNITTAVTLLGCTFANAAITYVDADVNSNTTLADGTALVDGSVGYATAIAADNLWDLRSGLSNGSTVFQGGISEDAPRLRTSITGLTTGNSYEIYAYFWGAGGSGSDGLWRGRAGLIDTPDELEGYNTFHFNGSSFTPMTALTSVSRTDAVNLDTLSTATGGIEDGGYFSTAGILTEEADRRLYQVNLGTVEVDGTGTVNVFIDDLANTGQGNRTWYDGVGFQQIPEPSVTLLGAICVVGFFRRTR